MTVRILGPALEAGTRVADGYRRRSGALLIASVLKASERAIMGAKGWSVLTPGGLVSIDKW
jgi:hypothetical protein